MHKKTYAYTEIYIYIYTYIHKYTDTHKLVEKKLALYISGKLQVIFGTMFVNTLLTKG